MVSRWWLVALLCSVLGSACGADSSGSSAASMSSAAPSSSPASLPVGAVQRLSAKGRAVAAAYRRFSEGYVRCFNKLDAGVLQNTTDFASCTDDGWAASNLAVSIAKLQKQVIVVVQRALGSCKATAQQLATAAEDENTASRAIHTALQAADIGTLNHEFEVWRETAAREHRLNDALVHACR